MPHIKVDDNTYVVETVYTSEETGKEIPDMSETAIAEEMPNGDDSDYVTAQHFKQEPVVDGSDITIHSADQNDLQTQRVYVTAEQLEQAGIKATHVVIHDQGSLDGDEYDGKYDGQGPASPGDCTPSTPNSKKLGFRYQWDESVHNSVLPVRCKTSNGMLFKNKFGSGGRGRCIKMHDTWYTPNEFEAVCGRASSKDWKRSIRYGGRPLQCLIEDNLLQPHATSCTCSACCDDEAVTGPVRLFVPYKRRKRDSAGNLPPSKKMRNSMSPGGCFSPNSMFGSVKNENSIVQVTLGPGNTIHGQPVRVTNSETGETIHIITADASGNIVAEPTVMMHPLQNHQGQKINIVNVDSQMNEQKQWWQLEEMANNLMIQVQQLKQMIETARQQSAASREATLHQVQQLRAQMDKEKAEAVNAVRIETQMQLSKAIMDERNQREIAIQQALSQARNGMDKNDSIAMVPDSSDKVSYTVTWATQPNNIETIMETTVVDDKDQNSQHL